MDVVEVVPVPPPVEPPPEPPGTVVVVVVVVVVVDGTFGPVGASTYWNALVRVATSEPSAIG
jgi:hypothetical protein